MFPEGVRAIVMAVVDVVDVVVFVATVASGSGKSVA